MISLAGHSILGRRQALLCGALVLGVGCVPQGQREVIVYTALDEGFSLPILEEFTRRTGIDVRAKFDTESTKTVGLTQAILAERNRPRCDLFWNNEIVNTLRLEQAGLLDAYAAPGAAAFPRQFRSPENLWHGFAARARVLLVNTELVREDQRPDSIFDLVDARWSQRAGIAKPLAGTTATHAACLFAVWGDKKAIDFFRAVKSNCRVLSGNKGVAQAVGRGELAFGLTDTDDAMGEIDAGRPVTIVYPDQASTVPGDAVLGTLLIPNTLALIRGSAGGDAARQLVDYLLLPEVEAQLAAGASAQIPLHREVDATSRANPPADLHVMEVDFRDAAQQWEAVAEFLRDEFATAE